MPNGMQKQNRTLYIFEGYKLEKENDVDDLGNVTVATFK